MKETSENMMENQGKMDLERTVVITTPIGFRNLKTVAAWPLPYIEMVLVH